MTRLFGTFGESIGRLRCLGTEGGFPHNALDLLGGLGSVDTCLNCSKLRLPPFRKLLCFVKPLILRALESCFSVSICSLVFRIIFRLHILSKCDSLCIIQYDCNVPYPVQSSTLC